jgi:FixJ family two-component response regulator
MIELEARPRMSGKGPVPFIGIVDDDPGVRESISSLIRSAGYKCVLFESAESFLTSGHAHDIGCLIVDFRMPGLDALELHRRLVDTNHAIPIILISARDHEVRERALKQGIAVVFGKPFPDKELLHAIQVLLA